MMRKGAVQLGLALGFTLLLVISFWLSFELRWDFEVPVQWRADRLFMARWVLPLELLALLLFGQFRGFLSYFRFPDLLRLLFATGSVALVLFGVFTYANLAHDSLVAPPRSVILANFLMSTVAIAGARLLMRLYRERFQTGLSRGAAGKRRRVAIVGAGDAGAAVAADLLAKRGFGLQPVVFLDDDSAKHGHDIHGIPVAGAPEKLTIVRDTYDVEQIVIALPARAHRRVREIVALAKSMEMETEIVPSLWDLATGQAQASRIRPVDFEDLLGREPVELDSAQIRDMLRGRVVLVTGAGGSIGSELCRQIANRTPTRLILVDQCEVQLFQIEQELIGLGHGSVILPCVCSVLDSERMAWLLETYRPAVIFHAAAHKHVPMMEHQPGEALKNNSLATGRLARQASQHGVERFVLISTDKAINPTSVMGCTKRIAEIAVQAVQQSPENQTRFCAVRFGNVLGSSGSVIPTFKRQIAEGGPITVTHPDVMRYFMTIPEAVGLVLQAATQAAGGEIFVLDMGQPIKIADVARQLIELSGFRPEIDIEIKYIGLRPGEKLFEELQHHGEQFEETAHKRISRLVSQPPDPALVVGWLRLIEENLHVRDRNALKKSLVQIVPEYSPFLD